MPYENEHSCRLANPDNFDGFVRQNDAIDVGGKKADRILGKKGGKVTGTQAVRFPKSKFSADEARSWCGKHGGSFEAAKGSTAGASAEEDRVLTIEEVKNLNKDGFNLDDSGNELYLVKFLFNDKLNQAGDPIPFQIATESLDKIAKTFIKRPYVFNPGISNNVGQHVRGPIDDPKKIIQYQKKFALGEIVNYYINKINNNVNGIVRIFPEYAEEVLSGKIPLPTSPLLEPLKWDNNKILDARGLHLQAVKNPGYPIELASITGACQGMLDKCMTELRTLGASRKLKNMRKNFINTGFSLGGTMPDHTDPNNLDSETDDNPPKEMTNGELTTAVHELKQNDDKMMGMLSEMHDKMIGEEDDKTKPPTTGAAGEKKGNNQKLVQVPEDEYNSLKEKLTTVETDYNKTKEELDKEKKKIALEKRTELATIIAKGELMLKKIEADKLKERIDYWVKLTDEETKQPKDLSLLAQTYKELEPKTVGSADGLYIEYPEMTGDSQPDTYDIMKEIG